jgi:hypothetical protein
MAWEAGRIGSVRRMRLAQLVLRHRVLPQDPLAAQAEPEWLAETVAPADGTVHAAGAVDQVNVF